VAHEWEGWPEDTLSLGFDAALQRYARLDKQGGLTVCRLVVGRISNPSLSGGQIENPSYDCREEVLFRLPAHGKPGFSDPRMSPDGRFVAYGHSMASPTVFAGVRVWKLDGPEPAVLPLDEPAGINEGAIAFHPNDRQLAIGHSDRTVSVYDLATGRRVQRLAVSAAPFHLAFHPHDGRLAVACGNAVQLFDAHAGRELLALRHPARVTWMAWHPDGRRLAAGCNDRKIHLWDTETATEVMPPWTGHTADGLVVGFNRTGDRLVSHDWGGQTRLWDTATGRMLLTMPGTFGWQFSPDDRLLGWGRSGSKIRLYRLATGRELRVLRRRHANSLETIGCPVVHADGRTLAASSPDWLSFFDLASGEELGSVRLPYKYAADPVFFDPSGGWMTGGYGGLFLWPTRSDPAQPSVLGVGPAHQLASGLASPYARGASASKDGRVVAVPQGGSTLLVHRDHPERRLVLGPQDDVRFSAVSPDGRWVVTCSHWWDGRSSSAQIWNADTGEKVRELPLERSTFARFSSDGHWLLTTIWLDKGDSRLWEVGTWREVRRFEGGGCFSPDGRLLALDGALGVIPLVETGTGREVARLTGPEPMSYLPACFSPDGTRLIASRSSQTALYVWDLRLIRQQLKELGLDWDWDEFKPADPASKTAPAKVEVDLGELAQPTLTAEQKARQAIEQYRSAIAANPDDTLACNNLAWVYLTAPEALRDVKAAVPLAEKAVRLAAGEPLYRNTLGLAYYRDGRYRDAVDTLRPNLDRQDDNGLPFDLYFLAMSYHRLGETTRAQDHFHWAVRWVAQRSDLAPNHIAELAMFRAEAAELLGIEKKSGQ
jgi:WD40 repeat protein